MIIDFNGLHREHDQFCIRSDDRAFTLGDGIFETIRFRSGKIDRFDLHMKRFFDSASFLEIPLLTKKKEIEKRIKNLVLVNNTQNAVIRITLSRGISERGLLFPESVEPNLIITLGVLTPSVRPINAVIATSTRRNELSPLSRIKSLNYLDNIFARREAEIKNSDEALILNTIGLVAESTISNLFLLQDGVLVTPRIDDGAFPGVMRDEIIKLYNAKEKPISPDDIKSADEAFLSNALGIRPLVRVDDIIVGTGEPGSFTMELASTL